jgi:alpha-tubulin suppressor-like RCC1 family protein
MTQFVRNHAGLDAVERVTSGCTHWRAALAFLAVMAMPITAARAQPVALSDVDSVATSSTHSCAVRQSGTVACWGRNDEYQLGDGTKNRRTTPVDAPLFGSDIKMLAAGIFHTCALTRTGTVRCSGAGLSTTTPKEVSGLGDGVRMVAASRSAACALTAAGGVKCWGSNFDGVLGDGTTSHRGTPVDVVGLQSNVRAIGMQHFHACALMENGQIKCWGSNSTRQLGDGTTTTRLTPVDVLDLGGPAVSLAVGSFGNCAVLASGPVKCWGFVPGFATQPATSAIHPNVPTSDVVEVSLSQIALCYLRGDRSAHCLGSNSSGLLGAGATANSSATPMRVSALGKGVRSLSVSQSHGCAVTQLGEVQCWGGDPDGQLGIGQPDAEKRIRSKVSRQGSAAIALAAGGQHACLLDTLGQVKCWGANLSTQLGDGTDLARASPVDVVGLPEPAQSISAGNSSSCALTRSGAVYCWGVGDVLGDAPYMRGAPMRIGLTTSATAISAGGFHACALDAGGAVSCWGEGNLGQLGVGTTTNSRQPRAVVGLAGPARAISSGYYHTCAVLTSGQVQCWGENKGALGDGTQEDRRTPVFVSGLSGIKDVSSGFRNTCALGEQGRLWCWGFGQLYPNQVDTLLAPMEIGAPQTSVALAAVKGTTHCVIAAGGALRCWGNNRSGQVGDGTTKDRNVPVIVTGFDRDVAAAVVGGFSLTGGFTCALGKAGTVSCFGSNDVGQLGIGSLGQISSPQKVAVDSEARKVVALAPTGNGPSERTGSDASGRYVVFESSASNLVAGDSNGTRDVFRYDRETTQLARVSVDSNDAQVSGGATRASMAPDAGSVLFVAPDAGVGVVAKESATDATARRKGGGQGLFLRNIITGTTQRVAPASVAPQSGTPRFAAGGGAVVYTAANTDPARGAFGQDEVFVAGVTRQGGSLVFGTPRCVSCKSIAADGTELSENADGASGGATLSADARYVAWNTTASNSVAASRSPCNGTRQQLILRDLQTGVARRIGDPSATAGCAAGTGGSRRPSLDAAGISLVFESDHALVAEDADTHADIYLWDAAKGVRRLSQMPDGTGGNGASTAPTVSTDGTTVNFVSAATNLDTRSPDNNDVADLHSLRLDVPDIQRLTENPAGDQANGPSDNPATNNAGSLVAFDSTAKNLSLSQIITASSSVFQRVNPLSSITGMRSAVWWNPAESGWGVFVFDQGSVLLVAWYTYDVDGEPTWFLAPAYPEPDGGFRGDLLKFTGVPFAQIAGDATRTSVPFGELRVRFPDRDSMSFTYTIGGRPHQKQLVRFPFAARHPVCDAVPFPDRASQRNYSDAWWGGDGGSSGWGLFVFHLDDSLVASWYTYDTDGEAVFFVMPTTRQADGSFSGDIFRQPNGTPFLDILNAPASAGGQSIGRATFRFADGQRGTFEYRLGSVQQTKPITRFLAGRVPSVCR